MRNATLLGIVQNLKRFGGDSGRSVLDEGRTRKRLPDNRMSDIINLETGPNPEYLQHLVDHLTHHLKGPENRELRRAFAVWINRIVLKRLAPGTILPEVNELNEVQNMLAERVTQWTENWKQEGMQKGIPMGQQKEAARMLYRQLTRRFGILSIETRQKLENAPTEQLEQWGENLMDAKTLEEVFL